VRRGEGTKVAFITHGVLQGISTSLTLPTDAQRGGAYVNVYYFLENYDLILPMQILAVKLYRGLKVQQVHLGH
jgi:hypothetical protein